jgi:hypothetical protein
VLPSQKQKLSIIILKESLFPRFPLTLKMLYNSLQNCVWQTLNIRLEQAQPPRLNMTASLTVPSFKIIKAMLPVYSLAVARGDKKAIKKAALAGRFQCNYVLRIMPGSEPHSDA